MIGLEIVVERKVGIVRPCRRIEVTLDEVIDPQYGFNARRVDLCFKVCVRLVILFLVTKLYRLRLAGLTESWLPVLPAICNQVVARWAEEH